MSMDPGVGAIWSYSDNNIPSDNVTISVDVEPRQGMGGLLFGFANNGSEYYRLMSGADGSYVLEQRTKEGIIKQLARGEGAGTGRLSVVLQDSTARIYFERTLLDQLKLPTIPRGAYGMIITSSGAGESFFDMLIIQHVR